MTEGENIVKVNIDEQMKSSYIDYSMSVIVARALPDVRDGLKPVHRRVLFGMRELGMASNRPYKKSARIVGEVLGKYHPHGDSSVYFAMVRMAQPWSLRYPLVDGQGNFGSIDGDSPAAMRYTEVRFQKVAEEMLEDLDKDTVDFQSNFDDTLTEPKVLPTRIPNLLVNGSSGIAVGMATNMPPHNLSDTIDAVVAQIDNESIDIEELIKIIKAPDFPTGGIIYGYEDVKKAYRTGRGRVVIRAKYEIEVAPSGKERIVITEIPYMVNKAELVEKVAEMVNDKKIDGIVYANDESDRDGMRIVFVLKQGANANVVVNQLFKYTALQSSFSVNNIALADGRPKLMNLKQLIGHFIEHRHEIVLRRTRYELREAEKRAHYLEGLLIALDHLDEVINLIRSSENPEIAKNGLMTQFGLSEIQAKAILEMRLQRLTGLERDKIRNEYTEIKALIAELQERLQHKHLRMQIVKDELLDIKKRFGDGRKTEIVYASEEFNPEDFFKNENVVITISNLGYLKRTSLSEFRTQNRGGRGAKGGSTRDEDFIRHIYIANMHSTMIFFTQKGKCFWQKVYEIPEGSKASKGRAIQNLIAIDPEDYVCAYMNVQNLNDQAYIENNFVVLCTRKGTIKKTSLEAYSRPRQNGIMAINVEEGDLLLDAKLTTGNSEILMGVKSGKAIRFHEKTVRPMGRTATGVRGVTLEEGDEVVGLVCVENAQEDILVVSEHGYGKRSPLEDYRVTNRGGKGVKTINVTEKTGHLVAIKSVNDDDDIMIINRSGLTIRVTTASIRLAGRNTQGVRLINIGDDDAITSVARVRGFKDDDTPLENAENMPIENIQADTEAGEFIEPISDNTVDE